MHRLGTRCLIPSLLLVLGGPACGPEGRAASDTPCALQPPRVTAHHDWPGGGHELWVRVGCQDGRLATPGELDGERLTVEVPDEATVGLSQTSTGAGLTLLVLRPGKGSTRRMLALVEAFIEERPAGERIALYGWGEELVQLSDFRSSRAQLRKLAARLGRVVRDGTAAPTEATLKTLFERVARTGGRAQRGLRSVVIVSDATLDADDIPPPSPAHLAVEAVWAMPRSAGLGDAALRWDEDADPQALATELSARLDAVAKHGFVHVAVCGNGDEFSLQLASGPHTKEITLEEDLSVNSAPTCDVDDILKGRRSVVDTVSVVLDAQGEALYQARLDELQRLSDEYDLSTPLGQLRLITEGYGTGKDDFPAQVSLSTGYEALAATAHLRGQGAAFCPRPSLSINLDEAPRHFTPSSAIDQFYLIAGCEDPGFYGYLGDTLYGAQGVFPLEFRFVELVLRGETRGVYVWMEQREQKLKTAHAALRGTVRRRYERVVEPEVDSVIGHDDALRASYDALLGPGVGDEDYAEYLDERLDVDGYLRWIALNSLLMNSDSLDESVFVATESIAEDGSPADYFDFMGWDPQTIFMPCEPATDGLVVDEHGLTYCQASTLDARVLGNAVLYARYVEVLREVLHDTDEARLQQTIDAARAELEPLLEREGTAAAMNLELSALVESNPWLGVSDAASARAHLDAVEAEALRLFTARRAELQAIVDDL